MLLLGTLLLLDHLVKDGHDPVLKRTVVRVGNQEVADTVETLLAETGTVEVELAKNGGAKALDKVLLDTASGGHKGVDELVLGKEEDDLAEAGRDEVRGVAKEEGEGLLGVLALLALKELDLSRQG